MPQHAAVHAAGHAPWLAFAALATSTTLVGSYVGLSKLLVAVFPVFLLAWLRFLIAALAMPHWLRRAPGEAPLDAADRKLLFLESFLGNFLFSICMLYGVKLAGALAAGVVMAAIPAAVAVGSWWVLSERINARTWAAIACAVAGVVLLTLVRSPLDASGASGGGGTAAAAVTPWLGYALLVGAVVCEASYVVIGKRLTAKMSPRRISALINLWGLVLITPFGLVQAWSFDFAAVAAPTWVLLVFYSWAASIVTVWLWMKGLQQVPAAQSGVFMVMVPIGAAAVGIGVLGEAFGSGHAVAFGLALAGVLLATWPARSGGRASQPPSSERTPPWP
jgi:drug/metabolite transporter (DMT)-like permease